jgi:hypothetical protein
MQVCVKARLPFEHTPGECTSLAVRGAAICVPGRALLTGALSPLRSLRTFPSIHSFLHSFLHSFIRTFPSTFNVPEQPPLRLRDGGREPTRAVKSACIACMARGGALRLLQFTPLLPWRVSGPDTSSGLHSLASSRSQPLAPLLELLLLRHSLSDGLLCSCFVISHKGP